MKGRWIAHHCTLKHTNSSQLNYEKRMIDFWEDVPGKEWSGIVHVFGFRLWKQAQTRPFFGKKTKVIFHNDKKDPRRLRITPNDRIAVWGMRDSKELRQLAKELHTSIVRIEDGFIRSIGLGSDFYPPISLIFDKRGIYFNSTHPSDLEHILKNYKFTENERKLGREIINLIINNNLTKYNINVSKDYISFPWMKSNNRQIIFVPGQVEDDASIIYGCEDVRSNIELLKRVREEHPDAFIVYKPHPEIIMGNRTGAYHLEKARKYCNKIETNLNVIECINKADIVHVMTSLTGFEALLRDKPVVCHGKPFYSGWGLTKDKIPLPRRGRKLRIEELAFACLALYPIYCVKDTLQDPVTSLKYLISSLDKLNRPHINFGRRIRKYTWQFRSLIQKIKYI